MGKLLRIYPPELKFPKGVPFECPDEFNGKVRGTWWYRDRKGNFVGPFETPGGAQDHLEDNEPIEPYQDSHRYWWWNDRNGTARGPYDMLRDADVDISAYVNGVIQ